MWCERTLCARQVNQRDAQNHRVAHDIKPDSNATHGVPFDEYTPDSDVTCYFHYLACLGKRTTLNRILRGRNTPEALYLYVWDRHRLCEDYVGRGNGQYSLGHQDGGETAE